MLGARCSKDASSFGAVVRQPLYGGNYSTSIIPGTSAVVCATLSIISSQLFDIMRAVARTGTHVRSRNFPTSPTLNPGSQAVALVRKSIPTSAFSSTRAFSYKLQALVRNISTRAFNYSALSQNDINQQFHGTKPLETELEADTSPHP